MTKHEALVRQLSPYVRLGDVAFDVGANVGDYTFALAELVGSTGQVTAFEPGPQVCGELRTRLENLPTYAGRIEVRQHALGAREDAALLAHYRHWTLVPPGKGGDFVACGDGTERFKESEAFEVRVEKLDAAPYARFVNFIKIDVDGWELAVLQGARWTLYTRRPTLLLEFCPFAMRAAGTPAEDLLREVFALPAYYVTAWTRTERLSAPQDVGRYLTNPEDSVDLLIVPEERR